MGENKEILVKGFFAVNLGDDLFFKILFERYPNINFYFYNNSYYQQLFDKYNEIYDQYNNVKIIKYNKIRRVFEKINYTKVIDKIQYGKYDACVFIGGSIFIDQEGWESTYKEKKNVINYFSNNNKSVFIIGSNFGPVRTRKFVELHSSLFEKCKDICFRDLSSYKLFSDKLNVRYAPDIVFNLKPKNVKKISNTIGISLIEIGDRKDLSNYREVYFNKLKEIIELAINKGKRIRLFSFCEIQGDLKIINELIDSMDNTYKSSIEVVNYDGNIEEFLIKFEEMENIIATRFHACILSQVFGQGLYPIIYSDKTYNVLKDIGLNNELCTIKEMESLDVEHLLNVIHSNKITDKSIFERAEKQFERFDEYVGRK